MFTYNITILLCGMGMAWTFGKTYMFGTNQLSFLQLSRVRLWVNGNEHIRTNRTFTEAHCLAFQTGQHGYFSAFHTCKLATGCLGVGVGGSLIHSFFFT
mmetsp:Transcript_53719/g.95765  ORF Transcript_53719/g.95765 Transcript_53719/m.95765 type:complete len:99 (+) Transcript_53719:762-1058(+)